MHLTLTNILKSLLLGTFEQEAKIAYQDDYDHKYIRGDVETRGPCPGLNALANQGYLYVSPFP